MTNLNCDQLVDYLNGTLTEKEAREFEQHLKTCKECQEIIEATGELPYLAKPIEPPSGMKARILANVFEDEAAPEPAIDSTPKAAPKSAEAPIPMKKPIKRSWWTPMIAAVLLLSLLGNAYAFLRLSDQPEIQEVALQPSEEFDGNATAAMIKDDESLKIVVQADQLAGLESSEVYQVWMIKGDKPVPAGAFTPSENGEGAVYHSMEETDEGWDTIAITREPQAGNELPKGEVVLSSTF
ncbi:anti-sigma factor [Planococcus sp. YIM B11945]|uniref:anti-sigma factor n=1 Tax=Planococcus sp. YIM B11945 TaxID=3435410 RepID=UPI003D7CF256